MAMHLFAERSDAWLAFRKQHVSATEIGSLLGVNSYLTVNQLIRQKLSPSVDRLDNRHIRDGLAAEAMTFKLLEMQGWALSNLAPAGHSLVFTDHMRGLSSTPDNFRWDGEQPAVVEVKKTTRNNFEKNWMGTTPPLRYLAQVQMQMHTTGMDQGYLCCIALEDNVPLSIYRVFKVPLEDIYDEMLVKYREALGSGKSLRVPTKIREKAVALLESSWSFIGVYRHPDTEESVKVEDLFQ